MSKHINEVSPDELIHSLPDIPEDFHDKDNPDFTKNFLGEIRHPSGKYYSNIARRHYYHPQERTQHLAPGHWVGYRWAIQNLSAPEDWVLDPTCGTGTAIVEAINNQRNGYGIELEYPSVANMNISYQQEKRPVGKSSIYQDSGVTHNLPANQFQLALNGPPYPLLQGASLSSDVHESTFEREIGYNDKEKNIGLQKSDSEAYWDMITALYLNVRKALKSGGFLVTIIKDPINQKKPYLLSNMIGERIKSIGFEVHGSFLHRHIPSTLFMHTYPKKFPEVVIPFYQTGMIYRKV